MPLEPFVALVCVDCNSTRLAVELGPGGPCKPAVFSACVFGRFDLAALCGCRTLNFCLFVLTAHYFHGPQPEPLSAA